MQRPKQLRTATLTRRSARSGYPEPDDFEGLPVRQWRREQVKIAPSAQQDSAEEDDIWANDLPFGMPKESHLLPTHTQELLRAARSGRGGKRSAPSEDDDPDPDDVPKRKKEDWELPSEGYKAKVWKQVPRNAETPTVSHLAKRHKNTITLASRSAIPHLAGPTVIRATVRRIDAAGNPYEQTVTLAEGQHVEGEIISTTVVPVSSAAKAETPLQQPTPVRRRPPPPKRKAKGVGRGRKKGKLPLPLPLPLPATRAQGTADGSPVKAEAAGPSEPAIKLEDAEDNANQDSEMADVSGMPSDEEEIDGGDGEEEEGGEEEAGDDEGLDTPKVEDVSEDTRGEDMEEVEDSEMSEAIQPSSVEEPDEPRPVVEEAEEVTIHKARFQPPTLVNLGPPQLGFSRIEGSPLKNVMILSPTEPSPVISPGATASTSFTPSSYLDVKSHTVAMEVDSGSAINETHAETKAQGVLPSLRDNSAASSPRASIKQEVATPPVDLFAPTLKEEAADTPVSVPDQPLPAPARPESVDPPTIETLEPKTEPSPAPQITEPEPEPEPMETDMPDASLQPPDSPALLPTVTEDEDDSLNLLGSLERELDRQGGPSNPRSGEATPNVAVAAAETRQEEETPAPADAPKEEELVETVSPPAPSPLPAATAAAADATAAEDAPKAEPVETASSSAAADIPHSVVADDSFAAAAAAAVGADSADAAGPLKEEPGVEDKNVKVEALQDEMEIDEVVPAAEPAAEPLAAAPADSG